MQILLVEPNVVLAQTYATFLVAAGHRVAQARTAQGAISRADDQRPDVVILELELARHNGIEFLYEFRSYPEWQTLPVIVQSNIPENQNPGTALWDQLCVVSYHYKPRTTLGELLRSVESIGKPKPVPR